MLAYLSCRDDDDDDDDEEEEEDEGVRDRRKWAWWSEAIEPRRSWTENYIYIYIYRVIRIIRAIRAIIYVYIDIVT